MKKFSASILLITIFCCFLTSCKKDKGNPPVLPPAESMTIDFSNFESSGKSAGFTFDQKGVQTSNWDFAAGVAFLWKSLIYTTLAVPVKSFQIAVDKTPVYLDNKTWQWSYNASITIDQVSVTYKIRLTGQIRSSDVLWKMYIAKEGTNSFAEFLWFEGTSKLDGTGGQWKLNYSSQYPEPVLQIDWAKTGTSIGTIKYTYVRSLNNSRATDPFKNSYIEYGLTSASLNAYYTIHYWNGTAFSDVAVQWSTTGKNGKVNSPVYFGNANWYCWDASYINITCP